MSIEPKKFFYLLKKNDINFFTGVPDSLLKDLCLCIDDIAQENNHIITPNEGNAIALASGYHIGTGSVPVVYMQNSGLGNAINPLLSLCDEKVYSIPMLVIVGWRGEPGTTDEPQHIKQGEIQLDLLRSLQIQFNIISKNDRNIEKKINEAINYIKKKNAPFVICVKKQTFEKYKKISKKNLKEHLLTREEALSIILSSLPENSIVVSTTGKTSREIFEIRNQNGELHNKDFLTVGSMGHCSSIALGIALSNPNRKIFCIDGDGSLIMHMGSLAMIGELAPENFNHILINNFVHESVGGQPTSAKSINFKKLIKSNKYNSYKKSESKSSIKKNMHYLLDNDGPNFHEVISKPGSRKNLGRPTISPVDNKKNLMNYLKK